MASQLSSLQIAQRQFEVENSIQTVDPDSIYKYDHQYAELIREQSPWKKDFHYFKRCKISAVALIKMVMHARNGGNIEVMGMLQGKIEGDAIIIMDTFAIPAQGIETRVDAGADGDAYIVGYSILQEQVGRAERTLGWYHSHPGYGCWLSGIDVSTQSLHQKHDDPWLAIVVDPKRTMAAGKVDIGAFRTYPDNYTPPSGDQGWQPIPQDKIEDFGAHHSRYYSLEVTFFKSSVDSALLDLLWEKYWVNTLAASSLLANRVFTSKQIADFASKLEGLDSKLQKGRGAGSGGGLWHTHAQEKRGSESALVELNKDCTKFSVNHIAGMMALAAKCHLFHEGHQEGGERGEGGGERMDITKY